MKIFGPMKEISKLKLINTGMRVMHRGPMSSHPDSSELFTKHGKQG